VEIRAGGPDLRAEPALTSVPDLQYRNHKSRLLSDARDSPSRPSPRVLDSITDRRLPTRCLHRAVMAVYSELASGLVSLRHGPDRNQRGRICQ
jgi:hypothetical protein